MIADVLRLTRWELFKLRRRWMPWILLFIGLAVTQATLWGFYSAYNNIDDPDSGGYPGRSDVEGIVTITCADIMDGTADAKVERVSDDFREHARERVEQRRRNEQCPRILEEVAERRWTSPGVFCPAGRPRKRPGRCPLHRRHPRHDPGSVNNGRRVRLGHVAYRAGRGPWPLAVPGSRRDCR